MRRCRGWIVVSCVLLLAGVSSVALSTDDNVLLMSEEWATRACEAWNGNPILTGKLAKWSTKDLGRGFKVIRLYRSDCEGTPHVELQIEHRDGRAVCAYGGRARAETLDYDVDYLMHAKTFRWEQMGEGRYGPIKGMLTGRLKFKGPRWEAMHNRGPFRSFLRLVGEVPSDATRCPDVVREETATTP